MNSLAERAKAAGAAMPPASGFKSAPPPRPHAASNSATPGHSFGAMETYEPEDKSFSKHELDAGGGEDSPNEGSVCMVQIVAIEALEVAEIEMGGYRVNETVEVTIGEGDSHFTELLDKCVCTMKEGERSYIKSKVDAKGKKIDQILSKGKELKFNITLKSFGRAADIQDLEADELLERAQHHKAKGSELYQKANLEFAVKRFVNSLRYLQGDEDNDATPNDVPEGLTAEWDKLECTCFLNLAACSLKRENFEETIAHCGKALALESANVKGLFRRGQAYARLHQYEPARADLAAALAVEPDNKAVIGQMRTVDALIKKEKDMYKKMFAER